MWSTTTVDGELCVMITLTIMMLKLYVRCLVLEAVQLHKTSENNIYGGLMWSTISVDEELCAMITWTIMMLKFSEGCLASQVALL